MATLLILVVALTVVANGDITSQVPPNGACLCVNDNSVNIRSTACGQGILGTANSGQCFRYTGDNTRCSLNGMNYQFFRINYSGNIQGWMAGVNLNLEPDFRCNSPVDESFIHLMNFLDPPGSPTTNGDEYTCQLTDGGRRVHELSSHTPYDCVDQRCQNTCKGGQCVAYVKCRCTKNGRYPPGTGAWRPGQRVKGTDGKCNRKIAPNTAIATFTPAQRYYGHAAVFIKCIDDHTVQVYDQWCSRSVGYSRYPSSHRFFAGFATIRSTSDGPSSISCRSETSGPTNCPASVPGCKSTDVLWKL